MRLLSPRLLTIIAGCLTITPLVSARAASINTLWSARFGDGTLTQQGTAVATDASGNIFITGYFTGAANFGGGGLASAGGADIFLAKYNSSGVHQWSKSFGSTDYDYAWGITTDASGAVIIVGKFFGTVNFGGGPLTSLSNEDIFVAKYNSGGVHVWSKRFGEVGGGISCYSVATDPSSNVIIAGSFDGTANFGGATLTSSGYPATLYADVFVAKFNSAGVHQWSQRFGDASVQATQSVATDGSGNVIITGRFQGTVNFGGADLTGAYVVSMFLAKFNSAGVHQWSQRFGDGPPYSDTVDNLVATDKSGNVFIAGDFIGTMNFGGSDLTSATSRDSYLAKFSPAGVHQWSIQFGDATNDQWARSVATDGNGNVVITGIFSGTINFGGGDLTSAGQNDIFVARLNPAGDHHWSRRFGDASAQLGNAVATDYADNVVITGAFEGTVDFGLGSYTSFGGQDIFAAKFNGYAYEPVITSITDIGNDQGQKVKVRFARADADKAGAAVPIVRYDAFRRDDPAPATSEDMRDAIGLSDAALRSFGWTQVGTVSAYGDFSYGIDVPTIGDSTIVHGQYYSVFFIRAATATITSFRDSDPDSGYSVDNLAPGIPGSLAFHGGGLSWNESSAGDFDYFTVYGANSHDFGAATVVDYTVKPTLHVSTAHYAYYFVTATDFSGNEGEPAVVNALTGVGGTPVNYALSISSYPNPFNPETTIRYTVPSRGHVSIVVYDGRGSRVATLLDEDKPAGAYRVMWNGRGDGGNSVSSGVYFAKLVFGHETRAYKMVLLK